MQSTKADWVRKHMESKRGGTPRSTISAESRPERLKPTISVGGAERSWGKATSPEVYKKYPCRDGVFEKSPEKNVGCDHGDSRTRARYGDYNWGRQVGGDRDLQPAALGFSGPDAVRARYLRSPKAHTLIGSKGPARSPWKDSLRDYDDDGLAPPTKPLVGARPMAGDLEVLVGYPKWLPKGVRSVFVAAETDDGAYDASDRMHMQKGVAWSGTEGHLGGALALLCRATRSVTLHIMGEGLRGGAPHSLGATTIGVPGGSRQKRWRLKLHAPLDIPIELVWHAAGDVHMWWTTDGHAAEQRPPSLKPRRGRWASMPDWDPAPKPAAPDWHSAHMHRPTYYVYAHPGARAVEPPLRTRRHATRAYGYTEEEEDTPAPYFEHAYAPRYGHPSAPSYFEDEAWEPATYDDEYDDMYGGGWVPYDTYYEPLSREPRTPYPRPGSAPNSARRASADRPLLYSY